MLCEARGFKQWMHGNETNAATDMLLLEARVSTPWMQYKSALGEACVRMLG